MAGKQGIAPKAFPPPVDSRAEFIKRTLDDEDERIEVGVAIVGGGTAGLACATRLLQLLADDPDTMERLGEVPVAIIEKAKTCGGHNLSGAVMRPESLRELLPDVSRAQWREEGFAFGEVEKEAVYMLPSKKAKLKIPTPPPFKNEGSEVISVAALCRYLAAQAEEAGAYVLTETSASQLLIEDGVVRGVRSGDKGRGKGGEELSNFEPGADITAKATVLAEGCWGHLTGAAIGEFGLGEDREPQNWELGVKEVWKVAKPLDRVIHTIGPWPLKLSPKYHHTGGTWIYPMKNERTGEDMVSIGVVADLDYADATTSVHDLLQTFKTHPLVREILEGGERVAWGAKALPGGGYWSMPKLSMPGAVLVGDAGGMVNTTALKGIHYAIQAGILAAEAIYAKLRVEGVDDPDYSAYEKAVDNSIVGQELYEVRNTRQPLAQKGLIRGGLKTNVLIATRGSFPSRRLGMHRSDEQEMFLGDTKGSYVQPDGKYTFDKLSSVFITGNQTRDDAPNHIRVEEDVPLVVAETWRWMCPAGVYEISEEQLEAAKGDPEAKVHVQVNYTNCVQCGAITAKGGRLTTPEGGDGPLYQLT